MRQTQSIIITLSYSVEVSRIKITSVQAAVEAALEHGLSAARFESSDLSLCVPSDDPFVPI